MSMRRKIRIKSNTRILVVACILLLIFLILLFILKPSNIENDPNITTKVTTISDILVYDQDAKEVISLPMDEYLVSVVAAEMPASFEVEALKAQAVSARTYTIYKSQHSGCTDCDEKADVCTDSSHCQAYVSVEEMKKNWGEEFGEKYLKIKSAVDSTSGEIIVYAGKPIEVFYHASSGGRTENSGNVFSAQRPYLVSVESEGEETSSNYFSEEIFEFDAFIKILSGERPSFSLEIEDLDSRINDPIRFDTGRVDTVKIGNTVFTGKQIRKAFGLNSTNFEIELKDNQVVFKCIGFGHGVGMSQTGANAMAKSGADYNEILKHYFIGVEILNDY